MSQQLFNAVERLQSIVDAVEEDLLDMLPNLDVRVELARDGKGNYILMDAYSALVQGYSALEYSDFFR